MMRAGQICARVSTDAEGRDANRQIEMTGFKSFRDRTSLVLDGGINGMGDPMAAARAT